MNTRLLSVLLLLFLGLGIASCSKDNDESGEAVGARFRKALDAYNGGSGIEKTTASADLISAYDAYKKNSNDPEWKKGFLKGATHDDVEKSKLLETLLDSYVEGDTDYPKLIVALCELFF